MTDAPDGHEESLLDLFVRIAPPEDAPGFQFPTANLASPVFLDGDAAAEGDDIRELRDEKTMEPADDPGRDAGATSEE